MDIRGIRNCTLSVVALLWLLCPASVVAAEPSVSSSSVTSSRVSLKTEGEPLFRLSLPTEDDYSAWKRPGFRVALGYGRGQIYGLYEVPEGSTTSFLLRAGARLDEQWSLMGTVRYEGAAGGLRYIGTIEPTFDIVPRLTLSVGLGLAGFVIIDDMQPVPPADGVVATYTYDDRDPPLGGCSGNGFAASARIAYSIIVGPIFATGPAISFGSQVTRCAEVLERSDPDTGRPIELEQYWYHNGFSFDWMLTWR